MDASSFVSAAFTLYNLTAGYSGSLTYVTFSPDGMTATLSFGYVPLVPGARYELVLNAAALKDRFGNSLVPVPPILFDTFLHPESGGPQGVGTVPANGETGVAINVGMYVVFDRPIAANLPYAAGISLTTASGPVNFTSTVAGNGILQITTPLLLPANQQVTVSVSGIFDSNGFPLAAPVVFSFTTGGLPYVQAQSLALTPPAGTPVSLPLHVTFAKPVDPPLMAAGPVMFQSYSQYAGADSYPAAFTLSSDHLTLTINQAQLAPGDYLVYVSLPFDRTAGKLNAFSFQVTVGASADPTPAQLLAASPPDGSLSVPVTATLGRQPDRRQSGGGFDRSHRHFQTYRAATTLHHIHRLRDRSHRFPRQHRGILCRILHYRRQRVHRGFHRAQRQSTRSGYRGGSVVSDHCHLQPSSRSDKPVRRLPYHHHRFERAGYRQLQREWRDSRLPARIPHGQWSRYRDRGVRDGSRRRLLTVFHFVLLSRRLAAGYHSSDGRFRLTR